MMGHTHSAAGFFTWVSVAPWVTSEPKVLVLGGVAAWVLPLGADLDHPNSRSTRALFGPLHKRAGNTIATVMGGHRAGMHSLWMILGLAFLAGLAATALGYPEHRFTASAIVAAGWAGGVWPDMLTKDRVKLLWPLTDRVYGVRIFTTNGWAETVFRFALYGATVWVAFHHYG